MHLSAQNSNFKTFSFRDWKTSCMRVSCGIPCIGGWEHGIGHWRGTGLSLLLVLLTDCIAAPPTTHGAFRFSSSFLAQTFDQDCKLFISNLINLNNAMNTERNTCSYVWITEWNDSLMKPVFVYDVSSVLFWTSIANSATFVKWTSSFMHIWQWLRKHALEY